MMRSSSLRRSAQEDSYKIYLVEFKSNSTKRKGQYATQGYHSTGLAAHGAGAVWHAKVRSLRCLCVRRRGGTLTGGAPMAGVARSWRECENL
jgi:hypothetical protein